MKNGVLTIVLIAILLIAGFFVYRLIGQKSTTALVGPGGEQIADKASPSPSPTPLPTAQQFTFNHSTDLKKELDSVDPKIEDPKIDQLKAVIKSF